MNSKWLFLSLLALLLTACTASAPNLTADSEHQQLLPLQQNQGVQSSSSTSPLPVPSATAGNADVIFVRARQQSDGAWTFEVTVQHPDTGWNDYADGWDVVLADGTVIKADPTSPFTRVLAHPHVDEQPFTRSQGGLRIPEGISQLTVRAHDMVDGWGGQTITVDLTQPSGPGFEVLR